MQGFQRYANALLWERNHEQLRIEPWGRDSLRVRSTPNAAVRDDLLSVLLSPEPTEVQITIDAQGARISNGALTASVSPQGHVRFSKTESGEELLAETPLKHSTRIPPRHFKALHSDLYHLEARFKAYEGERLYGLGQHQHGLLDQKGAVVELAQRNTEVAIPFLFSSRGYGLLWHNPSIGRVELGKTATRWIAEATAQLDYWITTGDTPASIMEHYADATGHAPEFPTWASGFWQCKLRYRTQDELLQVAREYKKRGLPLSVIVIDFFNWTLQGDWRFDPQAWPDPQAMVDELRAMGVELMVSVWPTVNPMSENFAEMQARGLLMRTERGIPAMMIFQDNRPEGPAFVQYYDATNPEARAFVWEQVREHYYQYGIKTWWLDACEPEMHPLDADNVRFHLGNGSAVANAYPMLHAKGFYDHQHRESDEPILNLCRSAWAGSQRYGVAVWSGDIDSTFEDLQIQVRAGLNMALSGIPWWTTDIGGFYGGDIDSPSFRELLIRWFQYSTFCPMLRLHGYRNPERNIDAMIDTGAENEAWSFGPEAYAIIKELLFLRERLRPYVEAQMKVAHEKGTPPMRPLFFDFPEDEECTRVDDQFLFGPDLLVAPILTEGARSRGVYLPAGTTWTDAWSGETFEGGHYITAEAPLERIPVYLRDGADVPIREGR
ncbi:family 31 glucosidase [Ktedonobacter sp. SOSP1-52]|uniref:glycoside hydrolase family 31 protein n=1 Tax=Ktedonobacter sp. SOSP1-52 TaxID=2778366 RepID=UPI0019155734|nr:glycoside hydrolase family 31 protein [Ktedonobacter sp. SOSP1-52]GHO62705.1 family 31 glucosidase [Ktedonobacter sp. SOSP1-52]